MHAKGKMKKKGMARGGGSMARGGNEEKGYAKGGAKMPMRKDPKTGKMIPAFAMDGKGKMAKGGMTKKKKAWLKVLKVARVEVPWVKKGGAGGMTVGQLRAAAKAKGYKIMKG